MEEWYETVNWEEEYQDLRKRYDALSYEIGGYLDEVRTLKHINTVQQAKIDALVYVLKIIRKIHRDAKQYDVSDSLRDFLIDLGFEVKDE